MGPLKYLNTIREERCLICGAMAEPHHLDKIMAGRDRKKDLPEHLTAVPLCREHHDEIERIGIEIFNVKHRVDVWRWIARRLVKIVCEERGGKLYELSRYRGL